MRKNLTPEILDAWDAGITDETWVCAAGLGNEIVDYKLVVEKGLEDVIGRIEAKPVSYTHLDVYKRQIMSLCCLMKTIWL